MKVAVTRRIYDDTLDELRQHFEVKCNQTDELLLGDRLAEFVADCDGALTSVTDRIDAQFLAACPHLKAVTNAAAGFNNVDLDACSRRAILVTNVPNAATDTTADLAFGLLLATARRIPESEQHLRAGKWRRWAFEEFLGADIHGSTLGIVGMGRIGRAVARRASGFDMRVLYHNRNRLDPASESGCRARYMDLDSLLAESDFVVLCLNYSDGAHHLIGAPQLSRMKRSAVLLNIARGGVVDEAALVEALRSGMIAAAGLDVFEGEPQIRQELLALRNVVLTPHIGSASDAARRRMCRTAAKDLIAALTSGNPVNLLNRECRRVADRKPIRDECSLIAEAG